MFQQRQREIEDSYKGKISNLEVDRDTWANRYKNSLIRGAITSAAAEHEAFDSEQIVALLQTKIHIVEDNDNLIPKVKMTIKENGKEMERDLTVSEAVASMKDNTDKYGNLFKTTAKGGPGKEPSTNTEPAGPMDIVGMSHEDYIKNREKLLS
ncbi:MAG: hypothetical protein CMK92_06040 [Pseudomonas sp.]|nr:hypothetical protein [Pseudomonas sp.]